MLGMTTHTTSTTLIRPARPEDAETLEILAGLDSSPALFGPVLLAEIDGNAVAAVGLLDGRVVADPFEYSAAAVALLRTRAAQLRPARQARTRRRSGELRWAA